jgi:hypothetical protein
MLIIMSREVLFTLCGVAVLSVTLSGQNVFMAESTSIKGDSITVTVGAPRFGLLGVIVGAPFSADQVSEHVQTLADGTHIVQNHPMQHMARDSQGRQRFERFLMPAPITTGTVSNENSPTLVEVDDSVGGYAFVLDEQNFVAHRVAIPPREHSRPPMKKEGGGPTEALAPGTPPGPERSAPEDLGTQTIEGIVAQGTRRTTTWPIGSRGNDRPIVDISETWYWRDLQMPVLSKNISPLTGDSTMRLTKISRAEPDPGLFQVPPGFTVIEEKGSFTMTLKRQQR